MSKFLRSAVLLCFAILLPLTMCSLASAQNQLTGAGSTAIYPVLSKWAETYYQKTKVQVNYQAIGSGGGIAQIKANTVAFGASDKPLKPEDLKSANLAQFPIVIIGITPVVNIPNIGAGRLTFDGKVLADIFLGRIKKWNDPAIKALNSGVSLPDTQITVVHRSDGSGTTFNFCDYLSKVSPQWKSQVGADTSVNWPTGVGGKGNPGVAAYVQQVAGAIGYVEYAYAVENKMAWTKLKNSEGKVVSPDLSSFQAAAGNADFSKTSDFYLIITNQPGAQSWPITGSTWVLLRKDGNKAQNQKVIEFVKWCLKDGQEQAKSLSYVPLPENVVQLIAAYSKNQLGI